MRDCYKDFKNLQRYSHRLDLVGFYQVIYLDFLAKKYFFILKNHKMSQ
jgi:hypothetical protein